MISYYSRRGGLGGVSIITEKSDYSLLSQLLIRDANPDDQGTYTWCQCYETFFPSPLITRPNKLECLSFPVKSLNLRARPEPTQLEHLSNASILGKLLVLPANVRLDWKVIARYKHSSLFGLIISKEGNFFPSSLMLQPKSWVVLSPISH